jgi:hypothetical protein
MFFTVETAKTDRNDISSLQGCTPTCLPQCIATVSNYDNPHQDVNVTRMAPQADTLIHRWCHNTLWHNQKGEIAVMYL